MWGAEIRFKASKSFLRPGAIAIRPNPGCILGPKLELAQAPSQAKRRPTPAAAPSPQHRPTRASPTPDHRSIPLPALPHRPPAPNANAAQHKKSTQPKAPPNQKKNGGMWKFLLPWHLPFVLQGAAPTWRRAGDGLAPKGERGRGNSR